MTKAEKVGLVVFLCGLVNLPFAPDVDRVIYSLVMMLVGGVMFILDGE